MITIPDAMRRPAEVERDELRGQLSEARAEIERLKQERAAYSERRGAAEMSSIKIEKENNDDRNNDSRIC